MEIAALPDIERGRTAFVWKPSKVALPSPQLNFDLLLGSKFPVTISFSVSPVATLPARQFVYMSIRSSYIIVITIERKKLQQDYV